MGSRIYATPHEKTFHEFQHDLLIWTLGRPWLDSEIAKPEDERHILLKWRRELYELKDEASRQAGYISGPVAMKATGNITAIQVLADDVYQLEHSFKTPRPIIRRLGTMAEFQSARYEIAVASIVARCGFKIDFIDDSSTKQPEFTATSDTLGDFAVEAKSRHRHGVLHQPGEVTDPSRADIARLFKKAVDQAPKDKAFIVFIDLNLAAAPGGANVTDKFWFAEAQRLFERWWKAKPSQLAKVSGVVLTNFGWHYYRRETAPPDEFVIIPFHTAASPVPDSTWELLHRALSEYGFVPDEEEHRRQIKSQYPEFS